MIRLILHLLGAVFFLAAILLSAAHNFGFAQTVCYQWPLRQPPLYDGDTLFITMPGLPPELARMSVRVDGVDTPEIRGKCEAEKELAQRAKARVEFDGHDLAHLLMAEGLGRAYHGGKREGWCE